NGVKQYLTAAGYGENRGVGPGRGLVFSQYYINQTTGTASYVSSYGRLFNTGVNAFDLYSAAMLQGADVMVRIGDTQPYSPPNPGAPPRFPLHWWAGPNIYGGNYHYLNGAGLDRANRIMYLADPDSNKGSGDADAGWTGAANDPGPAGRRYLPG